jgi:PAS domain S-box-containing protein
MQFSHCADANGLPPDEVAKRLSALEARVALSERTAGMGTYRWFANGDLPDWSPGIYRILGLDPTQPPLRNALIAMAHPEDTTSINAAIHNVIEIPGPFYVKYRIIRADGAERHIEVSGDVETDENGEMIGIVGVVTDVTRQIETEDQLRSALDVFRVLTEEANDLICRHSITMGILYCSPAITRILGYDPSDMMGGTFLSIMNEEDVPEIRQVHRELLIPGTSKSLTVRMRHQDGRELWVETMCRSVGDPTTGRVHEIVTVSRDVTERKLAELEINRARETAESANRTKSRFLATMSHELRTPLNAIIGFSDMIKSELFGPLLPRYLEYSELIHESGTLLLDLINDILDMSKIEAGKFELAIEDFDAVDSVATCARLLKNKAEQSGLTLTLDTPSPAPIMADQRAVQQILLNLAANAIKFTPRGGKITLAARDCGDHVALRVTDTGVGIAAADIARLGRPFEQVSQDSHLTKAGTGLGLALVRSLAQLHGGELMINSQLGRGTTVTVLLPKEKAAIAAAA